MAKMSDFEFRAGDSLVTVKALDVTEEDRCNRVVRFDVQLQPLCATQAQAAAPTPAAPAPLTDDEAIDKAIALANTRFGCAVGDLLLEQVHVSLPDAAIWPHLDPRQHRRELAKFDGRCFVRTVPYASAKPKPGLKLTNPWQLPEPCPDTVRSPEPEPAPKPCYYCQHPPGSHAPACIEVKYGHVG